MESKRFIPILFSTPMVRALLDGRKTQTRRIVKGLEKLENPFFQSLVEHATGKITFSHLKDDAVVDAKFPYGQPGDVLWVRESFMHFPIANNRINPTAPYIYKATVGTPDMYRFKPSIHMPKTACRLFLKVKSVRVERLNSISMGDAQAEGAQPIECGPVGCYRCGFQKLWVDINGKESWRNDPYVWVIEFESIEKPANFLN